MGHKSREIYDVTGWENECCKNVKLIYMSKCNPNPNLSEILIIFDSVMIKVTYRQNAHEMPKRPQKERIINEHQPYQK